MRQETTNARQEANKEPTRHPPQIAILRRRGWSPIRNSLCSPSARCTRAHTARLTANYRLSSTCIRLDYLQASNGESARVRKVPPGPHSSTHSRTGSQAAFPCDKHASNRTEMSPHRCGSRRAEIFPSYMYSYAHTVLSVSLRIRLPYTRFHILRGKHMGKRIWRQASDRYTAIADLYSSLRFHAHRAFGRARRGTR